MLKKRQRYSDINRLNKYNQFLSTLDNSVNNSLNNNNLNLKINEDKNNNKDKDAILKEEINTNLDKDEILKQQIDNIINNINLNFHSNNYSSRNFNGQNYFDSVLNKLTINDPNIFEEFLPFKPTYCPKKFFKPISSKIKDNIEPKEIININIEINNIEDLLTIINKYDDLPSIQYNINIKALHNIKDPLIELNNMIGMKELKTNIVDQILYFIQDFHKNNNTNGDFMHTVIYGPPGTGKTEIAKIMGKIYSKIGLLKKGTFKKVTRSDLVAGYLGQTALKTKEVITESLGGVLFIDEAYALGNPDKRDSFSKECIDTLCESLSDNKENLMVIIAGYEKELNDCFFNYNQGLDSRFTWRFKTDDYDFEDLYKIFIKKIKEIEWQLDTNNAINSDWFKKNKDYFKFYGRDIETILAKTKIAHSRRVFGKPENERKKINLDDLNKGLEIYLKNNSVKGRLEEENLKKQIYNSLYC